MDLQNLLTIVELQRFEIGFGKASAPLGTRGGIFDKVNRHGRTEYGETSIEPNDLLFVQPEHGTIEQNT